MHFSFFKKYLFIHFGIWVSVAVRGLSLDVEYGELLSTECSGFSLGWLLLL